MSPAATSCQLKDVQFFKEVSQAFEVDDQGMPTKCVYNETDEEYYGCNKCEEQWATFQEAKAHLDEEGE